MNTCFTFNERPVLNRLRLVRTSNRSRPVLIGFLRSLIGPVRFFEVLGLWWTGLGLGISPWRSKTETGPDFQSLINIIRPTMIISISRAPWVCAIQRGFLISNRSKYRSIDGRDLDILRPSPILLFRTVTTSTKGIDRMDNLKDYKRCQ